MYKVSIFVFLIFLPIYSQTPNSIGNLVHIHVSDDTVNIADTLGSWVFEKDDIVSEYFDVVKTTSKQYLCRKEDYTPDYFYGYYKKEIEDVSTGERDQYSYFSALDYFPIYEIQANSYDIGIGFWLFDDVFGHKFLSNDDSLYQEIYFDSTLYHICGKVDYRHFVICKWAEEIPLFFLLDLSNSPEYNVSEASEINFSEEDRPIALQKLSTDSFFIKIEGKLNLYAFEADSFRYLKTMLDGVHFDKFIFRDNFIYFVDGDGLIRFTYSSQTNSLIDKTILIPQPDYVDRNFNYALSIHNDSLYLYDINLTYYEKKWDISNLNYPFKPIMDYPDIYLHNQNDPIVSSINENKIKEHPVINFSGYPNPFNSSITFSFELPKHEQVELKIYDIVGCEIWSKQIKKPSIGKNIIQWNPKNLASGTYCVLFKSKNFNRKMKIMYLK